MNHRARLQDAREGLVLESRTIELDFRTRARDSFWSREPPSSTSGRARGTRFRVANHRAQTGGRARDARERRNRPELATRTPRAMPGGEHTRRRAIFHDLGNAPYHRRESFDDEKHERERAAARRDDDGWDTKRHESALDRERARALERARDAREVSFNDFDSRNRALSGRSQAKAMAEEAARASERVAREALEREAERGKEMASRTSVAERLKKHAEREVLELTRALEDAEKSKERAVEELEERLATATATMEEKLEALTIDLERANGAAEALNDLNAALEADNAEMREGERAAKAEVKTLTDDLLAARASADAATAAKSTADDELKETRGELEKTRCALDEVTQAHARCERELREQSRKTQALASAVESAKGNGKAARDLMRDSVMALDRFEDAATAREIQILKEHHAREIQRKEEEFAIALANVKASTGAVAHSTMDESQRLKRAMREVEEEARDAVRNARRKEEEAQRELQTVREELAASKIKVMKMIEAGEGKLDHASIREAQAARLAASQAQAICRDLKVELEAEMESAESARHEASEMMHKYFALRDKHEQREALVTHQKETIQSLKHDVEMRDADIDRLKAQLKEAKLCLRDNEMTYLNRQELTEEIEHLNRVLADANVRDRDRVLELKREHERADNYAERLEKAESQICEEVSKRTQLERSMRDVNATTIKAEQDALRAQSLSASAILLEAEILRLTRVNEQAEARIAELEHRVETLVKRGDELASSQNPNRGIRYLEQLREERELASRDAEEAGKAVQSMRAALQFVCAASQDTRNKVVQYAKEARKTGRIFTDAPGLPRGVAADIWARVIDAVARLDLDAMR